MFFPTLHEMEQGSEKLIRLSDYQDDDDEDNVTLTVELSESQAEWISFDDLFREFNVMPTLDTPLGFSEV